MIALCVTVTFALDVETGAEDGKKETYSTESLAKFAFSIFWRAMKFAKENRTPVLFDY